MEGNDENNPRSNSWLEVNQAVDGGLVGSFPAGDFISLLPETMEKRGRVEEMKYYTRGDEKVR